MTILARVELCVAGLQMGGKVLVVVQVVVYNAIAHISGGSSSVFRYKCSPSEYSASLASQPRSRFWLCVRDLHIL